MTIIGKVVQCNRIMRQGELSGGGLVLIQQAASVLVTATNPENLPLRLMLPETEFKVACIHLASGLDIELNLAEAPRANSPNSSRAPELPQIL